MSETDHQLIAEFNARRSETAFAALVRQHVNLVFATALRQVGDSGAAEEITQNVFVALAESSGKLGSHPTIAGWLYQTSLNKSRESLRSELRRRHREQIAVNLGLAGAEGDSVWSSLVPLLDEALLELREPDRLAVILHFIEGRTFHEVGSALGVGEDAARKRVNRCLDQLTHFFRRRGFEVPALAAGAPLFALSLQAAPAGLTAAATASGLAAAHASASTSTPTLIKGAMKFMAWTKAKTFIVTGLATILAVSTTPIALKLLARTKGMELTSDLEAQYAAMTGMTPEQAAKTYFEACGREDWAVVSQFQRSLGDKFENNCGGLQVMNLDTAYRGRYFDVKWRVFVPYKIRLKNGTVENGILAIRCDVTPDHHWHIDGGF